MTVLTPTPFVAAAAAWTVDAIAEVAAAALAFVVVVAVVAVGVAHWFVGCAALGVLLVGQGHAIELIVVPLPFETKTKRYLKGQNITGRRIKVHECMAPFNCQTCILMLAENRYAQIRCQIL